MSEPEKNALTPHCAKVHGNVSNSLLSSPTSALTAPQSQTTWQALEIPTAAVCEMGKHECKGKEFFDPFLGHTKSETLNITSHRSILLGELVRYSSSRWQNIYTYAESVHCVSLGIKPK